MATKRNRESESSTEDSGSENEELEDFVRQSKLVTEFSEVFSRYQPAYLTLGSDHTQSLCEGSGLSCIKPPEITYSLKLEPHFYTPRVEGEDATLSNAQLEAIVYACQAHETFLPETDIRKGFYIGDGTGAGKSRTLAGLVYENFKGKNSKTVWITVSSDLFTGIANELAKFFKEKELNIVTISELPILEDETSGATVVLSTYHALIQKTDNNRITLMEKLQAWMGIGYEGLLLFDESHLAKSVQDAQKASYTGKKVVELQEKFRLSKVVYSSATGASRPHHLLYMTRLGLYGPGTGYLDGPQFKERLESRGVGALELLAMEMKQRGVFVSRQLSYENVQVNCTDIEKDEDFVAVYNRCCQLWGLLIRYQEQLVREEREALERGDADVSNVGTKAGPFYAASLTFFGLLIMSSKLSEAEKIARRALAAGNSVVFGVQSTGEARYCSFEKEDWNEGMPFSYAREILRRTMAALNIPIGCPKAFVKVGDDTEVVKIGSWTDGDEEQADKNVKSERFRFAGLDGASSNGEAEGNTDDGMDVVEDDEMDVDSSIFMDDSNDATEDQERIPETAGYDFRMWPSMCIGANVCYHVEELASPENCTWSFEEANRNLTPENLSRLFHELALFLPVNPIDEIVCRMQRKTTADHRRHSVAVLTGRRKNYEYDRKNKLWKEKQASGLKEGRESFMNGNARVCVISGVASVGVDLHASVNCRNQQQRTHIVIQYAYGPEQFLQQLGRTHRSHQRVAPNIEMIKSVARGETRYISVINKRLEQLGAICHGHSKSSPLEKKMSDILCTKEGLEAINKAIRQFKRHPIGCHWANLVTLKPKKQKDFRTSTCEKVVSRVFNRNLMMPIDLQERFMDMVDANVQRLIEKTEESTYCPIVEIPGSGINIELLSSNNLYTTVGKCVMRKFRLSRLLSVDEAGAIRDEAIKSGKIAKIMKSYKTDFNDDHEVLLGIQETSNGDWEVRFPWNRNPTVMTNHEIKTAYERVNGDFEKVIEWRVGYRKASGVAGCVHVAKGRRCGKNLCFLRWGMYDILVLSEFTSGVLTYLESVYRQPICLARVSWLEGEEVNRTTGILVKDGRVDIIEKGLKHLYGKNSDE